MALYALTEVEVAILQRLLDLHRGMLGNLPGRSPVAPDDHQAPEVYIGLPQAVINPVDYSGEAGGDSEGTYDTAGTGRSTIYSLTDDGILRPNETDQNTYNVSPNQIPLEYTLMVRNKAGYWIPIRLAGVLYGTFRYGTSTSPCDVNVGDRVYSCILRKLPESGYEYALGVGCYIACTQHGWEIISILECPTAVVGTGTGS